MSLYFLSRRLERAGGISWLKRFHKRCNQGASLKQLADEFALTVSTVSRMRSALFRVIYVPNEDLLRLLEIERAGLDRRQQEHDDLFDEVEMSHLRIVEVERDAS